MHPKKTSDFFGWPEREDICWVPFEHILGILGLLNSSQLWLKLSDHGKIVNAMFDRE